MAEEDIIFGKNRHFFGGIEPSNMRMFKYCNIDMSPRLNMVLPDDTVINGQTLCTVAGVIIRGSSDHYPTDEFDGDLIADINAVGDSFKTVYLLGKTVELEDNNFAIDLYYHKYFAAFPYTTQGVYNRSTVNRCSEFDSAGYYYGFDIDLDDSNPATRVSYPDDVDNYGWDSVSTNSDGTFNTGDWSNALVAGQDFTPRPCLLYPSGVVAEYLDSNDYSKTVSGEESSISDSTSILNAMMEWPKIYTKRWEGIDGVYHFRCSNIKIDDDWECWCNYDANGNEIDHFYTAIYTGVKDGDDVLRSLYGLASSKSDISTFTTVSAAIEAATANGEGWYTDLICDHLLIQDLLVMIGRSTDCQTVFGNGFRASFTPGETNSLGLFGFTLPTNSTPTPMQFVKIFGMEAWWDTAFPYKYIAGLICDKGNLKVKITKGSHDGSTSDGYDISGNGYLDVANATPSDGSAVSGIGFISSMVVTPYGRFPAGLTGSSTTYECDPVSYNNNYNYSAFAGTAGTTTGPFAINYANSTSIYASLSYKPLAK